MPEVGHRKLIFRLGETGFLLELADIIEVVEQVTEILDSDHSDISRGIVAALQFRQTWIPVVDPALKLDIFSTTELKDKVAVILCGSEGNWALLVDRIEEVSAGENIQYCEIPFLLQAAAMDYYSQIRLFHNEPLIVFEPERYYGSAVVSA